MYVDGKSTGARVAGGDLVLRFNQAVRLGIGGLNYSNKALDGLPAKPFMGSMDEVSIWTRSLAANDIQEAMSHKGE